MKKFLAIVLTIMLMISIIPTGLVSITASAETTTYTEGYYTYTIDSGKATIVGVDVSISGDVVIPSILGGCQVTRIGSSAFFGCSGITSVTFPNSVTRLGIYAFCDCTSLTSVTIPNGVTYIGEGTFTNCKNLISITIPNSITSIAPCAFDYRNYNVCFCGTEEQWNAVYIDPDSGLKLASIYYHMFDNYNDNICNICDSAIMKLTPIITSFTDTTVSLVAVKNAEYSKDGINWQTNNIFTGLDAGTEYTFYQRYAKTDTHDASDKSVGISITTDKSKQTLIPDIPTVQSFTSSSMTLTIVDGCEFSKDATTWQDSNIFSGLSCGTEYTFYQRYKETATTYAGKSSKALIAKTDKGTKNKPSAPTLLSKTHNGVILTALSGYEYSRDGVNWQRGNVFSNLEAETNYMFYQRIAETDTHYASEASPSLLVKTNEMPACIIDPQLHIYDNNCDADCNNCGQIRNIILHVYSNNCDTICNVCKVTRIISHSYKTVITKATISKNGKKENKCNVCGYVSSNKTTIYRPYTFKLSSTSYTYNGAVKKPIVTVKDSAGKTISSSNYTVTYASGRKYPGTYKVTVKMKGNYTGTKTLYFKINKANVSKCKISLSATSYTYNGKVKTPTVTVKNASGTKLTKNTHYTVTYASGRKNVGKYKVTIKMKGNYTGTKTLYFTIKPKAASVNKLTAGTKKLTVKLNRTLSQSTGYQIQYSTSKTFKSYKTKTLTSYKTSSTTLTGLKAKTTYYVRVRTYKKVGGTKYYSGWSTYKYKKTK